MASRPAPPIVADGAADVIRRAPFSDNPRVGARGQRTRKQILDAALRVFGEDGYHLASIERISKLAGCSRVSFYQYFAGKEDVFRHLAGQVDRQLDASTERLDPLTPDLAGWQTLREWVGRYVETYERYEPVFRMFPVAEESDEVLAGGAIRTGEQYVNGFRARLAPTTVPARELGLVIGLLHGCLARTLDEAMTFCRAAPKAYAVERIADSYTDVAHRTLFGIVDGVNVRGDASIDLPRLQLGAAVRDMFEQEEQWVARGPVLDALIDAGRAVFVKRGYHATRVDDIVAAAGVSHGAFYHYFKNKDQLARMLAARAMRNVALTLTDIPEPLDDANGRRALRTWLRRYMSMQVGETAMIRVWIDASTRDEELAADSAPLLDWGRRRMERFLRTRGFGDVATEAVVLLALVDGLSARHRAETVVSPALSIIERGFLGR